jgi:hypothetical protein
MSKKKCEKSEKPRFYGQNKLLATWLYVGAPQKIQEK